jgi:hypothetical protein
MTTTPTVDRYAENYTERGASPRSWLCRRCGADVDSADLGQHLAGHPGAADDQSHEPWCDQQRHARTAAELGTHLGCIGHDHPIILSGQEYGGYWRQRSSGPPVLATDWPGNHFVELSVEQVRAAYRVALAFGASRDVDQVMTMLGEALDEFHGGDAWRDEL